MLGDIVVLQRNSTKTPKTSETILLLYGFTLRFALLIRVKMQFSVKSYLWKRIMKHQNSL